MFVASSVIPANTIFSKDLHALEGKKITYKHYFLAHMMETKGEIFVSGRL